MSAWDFLGTIIEAAFMSGLVAICVFVIWGGMLAAVVGAIMLALRLIEKVQTR